MSREEFRDRQLWDLGSWPEMYDALKGLQKVVFLSTPGIELNMMVFTVSSLAAGCRHCQAHGAYTSHRVGASIEKVQALWSYEESDLFDDRERAALSFALAAGSSPSEVTPEHHAALREHFTDEEVRTLISVVALGGYMNRYNDALATVTDQESVDWATMHLQPLGWEQGRHVGGAEEQRSGPPGELTGVDHDPLQAKGPRMSAGPVPTPTPRLTVSHTTRAVNDIDTMLDFYCGTLGFHITNRGDMAGGGQMVFISQDPAEHHQIVFISGLPDPDHQFVMLDHMAFRTGSLDDLRVIAARLDEAGVDGVIPINHGNAWSLYFNDPEGNGLECFVDSPFHVAQPFAEGLDLTTDDAAIEADTRAKTHDVAEFQPLAEWQSAFRARLDRNQAEA